MMFAVVSKAIPTSDSNIVTILICFPTICYRIDPKFVAKIIDYALSVAYALILERVISGIKNYETLASSDI